MNSSNTKNSNGQYGVLLEKYFKLCAKRNGLFGYRYEEEVQDSLDDFIDFGRERGLQISRSDVARFDVLSRAKLYEIPFRRNVVRSGVIKKMKKQGVLYSPRELMKCHDRIESGKKCKLNS